MSKLIITEEEKNTLSNEEMTNLNSLINTLNSSYNQSQPIK
jgi:hypothetical protein